MKLTQGDIIRACKALDKIMSQDTSLAVSKKVFEMRNKFQAAWDFQIGEENKIAARHPNVDPAKASVQFPANNAEEKEARLTELNNFVKEMEDLGNLEQEIDVEPFSISVSLENIKMAGKDIKALQGLITFDD